MISISIAVSIMIIMGALGYMAGAAYWHARYRDAQADAARLRRANARARHAAEVARRRRDALPTYVAGAKWAAGLVEEALSDAEAEQ